MSGFHQPYSTLGLAGIGMDDWPLDRRQCEQFVGRQIKLDA
jgi:hypothetical protein